MKKLSIILLALALALVFTVPAMAIHVGEDDSPEGSLGITGRYQFDGEMRDIDRSDYDVKDYFDDDLDISLVMIKGPVKAFVGLEPGDTNPFQGTGHKSIVDNYYIDWSAMDNLTIRIGEYGLSFNRTIGTDSAGARNIQATYSMDAVDISAALIVENDGANFDMAADGIAANAGSPLIGVPATKYAGTITTSGSTDDDNNTLMVRLNVKEAGPLTKLDIVSYTEMNDVEVLGVAADENSYIGVDLAVPVGPIDIAFEYGANGGDLDGDFMLAEFSWKGLENWDLGVNYFKSSDDYLAPYDDNAWSPVIILGDQINEDVLDISFVWLDATYQVNDKLRISGQALVMSENDAGTEYGTEVDIGFKYQISDNVSWGFAYGMYSAGDMDGSDADSTIPAQTTTPGSVAANPDEDTTEVFTRLEFTF